MPNEQLTLTRTVCRTVAPRRTVMTGGGVMAGKIQPMVPHGPGSEVELDAGEAARLVAAGFLIDPADTTPPPPVVDGNTPRVGFQGPVYDRR